MHPVSCAGCQALQRRLRDLQAENDRLRRQLDEATRAGKRQAAPFAKGRPAGQPEKPGRKPGEDYGTKAHRQPPSQEELTRSTRRHPPWRSMTAAAAPAVSRATSATLEPRLGTKNW